MALNDGTQSPGSTCESGTNRVVVVGAGASGLLVTSHLLTSLGPQHHVDLVDPDPDGRVGAAWSTPDERHLANVPVSGLSALPRDPDHYLRWLRRHHRPDVQPHEFAPRHTYGAYLQDLVEGVASFAGNASLHRHRDRAVDVTRTPLGFTVRLAGGTDLVARAVVLAIGSTPPGTDWAPPELLASGRLVTDPWHARDGLSALPGTGDLLLVGAGLTMVDVALTADRPGRTLHVVSRHDRLPERHVLPTVPPVPPPPGITRLHSLGEVTDVVTEHIRRTEVESGDWRAAVDGLRPVTAQLWHNLTEEERGEFLASHSRRWETLRHRMSPRTAERFDRLLDRRVERHRGTVAAARPTADGVAVQLTDGSTVQVAAVVNCTGPRHGLGTDPLLTRLADRGEVTGGPQGLGVANDDQGRAAAGLWVLGALRRGTLYESTAVPEIREQAEQVAAAVARHVRGTVRPRSTDLYGLGLSTGSVASGWHNRALARLLRLQDGVDDALAEAVDLDPGFAHAHASRALLAHEWGTGADWGASLRAAHRAAASRSVDDREASFLEAVTTRLRTDEATGAAALLRHVRLYPRDALAISVAVPTVAFSGLTSGSGTIDLVEWLGRSWGDDWWYAGQLAFVRQDQERWSEAEDLAAHSLSVEPAAGHAVHARTHVFLETGQHHLGLGWLDTWLREHGSRSASRPHFAWHAALHELLLDDVDAARLRYERELEPRLVGGTRAMVDSASLLWRGRMTDAWPATLRAPALRRHVPAGWLADPPTPFLAMHAGLTLAVTDDAVGLLALAARARTSTDPVLRQVVAPLADALLAVIEERWDDAARDLRPVVADSARLGGSAAQREVLLDTLVHVLVRAGHTEQAARLLDQRLDRRDSPADARRRAALRADASGRRVHP